MSANGIFADIGFPAKRIAFSLRLQRVALLAPRCGMRELASREHVAVDRDRARDQRDGVHRERLHLLAFGAVEAVHEREAQPRRYESELGCGGEADELPASYVVCRGERRSDS